MKEPLSASTTKAVTYASCTLFTSKFCYWEGRYLKKRKEYVKIKLSENVKLNQSTLCAFKFSKEDTWTISGMGKGIKLKLSGHVELRKKHYIHPNCQKDVRGIVLQLSENLEQKHLV